MAEAVTSQCGEILNWTADGTYTKGDVIQVSDGRAGVVLADVTSGNKVGVDVAQGTVYEVAKTTSMVVLRGSKLWWDHSANKVHLLHRNDRDFYAGVAVEDATSSATTVRIALNQEPKYAASFRGGFASVRVQTAGFVSACGAGAEGCNLEFSATAEAQKADALSFQGTAPGSEGVLHMLLCVNTNGDAAALDANFGLANGTHATDADSITESLFIHIDGNSANINLESDDDTTEVAATDTTVDFTAGTPFLFQADLSNLADIQCYLDGVNVLPASVFKLDAATGPLKLLAHVEKTSDDSPGNFSVLYAGVTTAQV